MLVHQIIHKLSTTALKWCLWELGTQNFACLWKHAKIGWNVPIPTDRDIICVLSFSLLFLGQETREPPYLYRWRFAVAWDSFQEESCPVSAQIWGDSTGPPLILKARLSGSLGIVSDFRGPILCTNLVPSCVLSLILFDINTFEWVSTGTVHYANYYQILVKQALSSI